MKKSKYFVIKENVYLRQTLVFIGTSKQDFNAAFKRIYRQDAPDTDFFELQGVTGRTMQCGAIVLVLLKSDLMKTAVHELFHAIEFHFDYIGITHSDSSSEAWAYYLQFMVDEYIKNTK